MRSLTRITVLGSPVAQAAIELTAGRGTPVPPEQNPALVYIARLSPGSRPTMSGALDTLAEIASGGVLSGIDFPWSSLRYGHAAAIRAALCSRYKAATTNKMLCALRGVLREAWRLGLLNAEDFHRAADVQVVRSETLPRGRALSAGEWRSLFAACAEDNSAAGPRDSALLAVAYGGGLRRSEIVALDITDFATDTGAITIRSGKGNKARMAYASNGAGDALRAWLDARGLADGPLFMSINKSGTISQRRLTGQAVRWIFQRRAQRAGVASFTPHDCRRSFCSDLLDAGADIVTVQKLANHASPTVTARYDRRGEHTKRRAAELLHVPFSRGK